MAEEIAFENERISNFEGLMTLTLDRVILHTIMHHSSTSTYMPNCIEIEETFCGRTAAQIHGQTFETGFIRSTLLKVDVIMYNGCKVVVAVVISLRVLMLDSQCNGSSGI